MARAACELSLVNLFYQEKKPPGFQKGVTEHFISAKIQIASIMLEIFLAELRSLCGLDNGDILSTRIVSVVFPKWKSSFSIKMFVL